MQEYLEAEVFISTWSFSWFAISVLSSVVSECMSVPEKCCSVLRLTFEVCFASQIIILSVQGQWQPTLM
jgi:hypothetical protein